MGIRAGLRHLVVAVSLAAAFVAVTAAPAAAGSVNGVCESGEICFYDNRDLTGSKIDFYYDLSSYVGWKFVNSPYWLNDNIESGKSYASFMTVFLYEHVNYAGSWTWWSPGQTRTWIDVRWVDNNGSSHYWN